MSPVHPAARVHSRYWRHIAGLPVGGQRMIVRLRVRRVSPPAVPALNSDVNERRGRGFFFPMLSMMDILPGTNPRSRMSVKPIKPTLESLTA
ncbi:MULTISPECIES: transposase family protein [unclassified Streptomyces]|uniref:transposase family protein n=1 Tax=unclassified Streptomyces TaxID=2593676 RepID=UPI0034407604